MGILDFLRSAIQPTAAAVAGYDQGKRGEEDRQREIERQSRKDQAEIEQIRANVAREQAMGRYYDAYANQRDTQAGDTPVTYKLDENGHYVPMPTRIRNAIRGGSSPSSPSAVTAPSFDASITGDDLRTAVSPKSSSSSPLGVVKTTLGLNGEPAGQHAGQQGPTFTPGQPTGIKAPAKATAAPHEDTKIGADGYYYVRQAGSTMYVKTNVRAPAKAYMFAPNRGGNGRGGGSTASQDRINAKTAYDEALKAMPRPSKTTAEVTNPKYLNPPPGAKPKDLGPALVPNPAHAQATADSVAYEQSVLGPLRQKLLEATKSPQSAIDASVPATPATGPVGDFNLGQSAKPKYSLNDDQRSAMETEMKQANDDLQAVLNSGLDDTKKKRARVAYDQRMKQIASRYTGSSK